jgi:hypothetical protein
LVQKKISKTKSMKATEKSSPMPIPAKKKVPTPAVLPANPPTPTAKPAHTLPQSTKTLSVATPV